jgi:MOSC domain-containing protein YiiM
MGSILAISISRQKGVKKHAVDFANFITDHGIEGDAHAGSGIRQVSLLSVESINKMIEKGLAVGPGDFAENITTKGIDLLKLKIGDRVVLGDNVELEITQIGKVCHKRCAIYYQAGDCVMPREGVFAKVIRGGTVKFGIGVGFNYLTYAQLE